MVEREGGREGVEEQVGEKEAMKRKTTRDVLSRGLRG